MNEWMNEQGKMSEWMLEGMSEQADDEWANGWINFNIDERMDACMVVWARMTGDYWLQR